MALIPQFFLDCVVAIGFEAPGGTRAYAATGFMYGDFISQREDRKDYRIYLVTNRHVFGEHKEAWVRLNPEADGPAREFRLELVKNDQKMWRGHPDPAVDVAAILINYSLLKDQRIRVHFFQSDAHALSRARAAELGVSEGDGVFVLGFPLGLVGGERNYVVVRQGAIARVRDTLAGRNKEFLVDTSIFPGNSGGPVVTRPEVVAIQGTKVSNKAFLVGVVTGYVVYQDKAISEQTKRMRITFEENSGLAKVVPTDCIGEILREIPKPPREEEVRISTEEDPAKGPQPVE